MNRIKQLPVNFPTFEKELWLLDNDSKEVVLVDESEKTWENYCSLVAKSNK